MPQLDEQDRPEDEELKELYERVEKHARLLGEHFDSVEIICTKYRPDKGTCLVKGEAGNYYARLGSVREMQISKDEDACIDQRLKRSGD